MIRNLVIYFKLVGVLLVGLFALYLINPLDKGFLVGYLLIVPIYINKKLLKQNLDKDFVLLLLLAVIYGLFYALDPVDGIQLIFIYSLFPPTFYLLGKLMVKPNNPDNYIFYLLFLSFALYSMPAVISVYLNFAEGGFAQVQRSIPYIWTGEPLSATGMGAFLTLNMCIPAILIAGRKSVRLWLGLFMIVLFILSLICAIRLGSRTQLSVFLITSIVATIYVLRRQTTKENVVLLFFLAVIVVFVLNKVSFDLSADWLSAFADRMDSRGSDVASGGGRVERWEKSLRNLFTKPLGWDLREFGYAHNLWLDVLRAAGIIPFTILLIYTVRSFIQIRKISRNTNNLFIKSLIFIYGLAFLLIFMVEPIFEGIFSLFVLFCFYKGVINKYYVLKTT